ncbi:uncharacterized protein PGTG_03820 [Puccinia graminis f. sp. tritici CRL 75-36-700-3]|uniref:Uncharacterized protein n=1 Tax=Puccinia graminis f. sp. tritici (strain CRL 75-36-700-3 / race SCCL) TaxID=418459 RepID=E3K0N9_PUCGT|nr:uncharacterized protein PGTG_03820 [Puccinia graminis f. sp. tritici CRL 75-36-700-3]EFP77864.2 hypothetical protein PGTG_03820 [Puccinia graminis f. sp. tritici CRL 75-36-700-3]
MSKRQRRSLQHWNSIADRGEYTDLKSLRARAVKSIFIIKEEAWGQPKALTWTSLSSAQLVFRTQGITIRPPTPSAPSLPGQSPTFQLADCDSATSS